MIQKEKSAKDWFTKLIDRLRRGRTGGRDADSEFQTSTGNAKPCPLCGVVAINWTTHNKWCHFVIETKNTEKLLVGDGGAVRVPADPAKPQRDGCIDPAPVPQAQPETTPYQTRYKCPYGKKNCGENSVYCEPCNKDYEEFLLLLNDDR